ncbi:MAG: hypothetical protein ACM3SY_10480 [Candidatus Omnitrophota bacterium]
MFQDDRRAETETTGWIPAQWKSRRKAMKNNFFFTYLNVPQL